MSGWTIAAAILLVLAGLVIVWYAYIVYDTRNWPPGKRPVLGGIDVLIPGGMIVAATVCLALGKYL